MSLFYNFCRPRKEYLWWSALFGALFGLFYILSRNLRLAYVENGTIVIQDFAYYLTIVQAFWFDNRVQLYLPAENQLVLNKFMNMEFLGVMPLATTPILTAVLWPFSVIGRSSLNAAYSLWLALSFIIFIWALASIVRKAFAIGRLGFVSCGLITIIILFSWCLKVATSLGQTSILSAGLICIFVLCLEERRHLPSYAPLRLLIISLILSIKPTYFALALGALLIYGECVLFMSSLALFVLMLCGLTIKMGLNWPVQYIESMRIFTSAEIPPLFASGFEFRSMNIFRSAFVDTVGVHTALIVSYIGLIGGMLVVVLISLVDALWAKRDKRGVRRVNPSYAFSVLCACYLSFAPYAGGYEDLILVTSMLGIALTPTYIYSPRVQRKYSYLVMAIVTLLAIVLNKGVAELVVSVQALWLLKCSLIGVLAVAALWPTAGSFSSSPSPSASDDDSIAWTNP